MFRLKMFVLSAAVLGVFFLFSSTAYAYSGTGTVTCSGYLNIRQSAGTSSKIVGKLYPGTVISIEDSTDGWYKITYNGINGWVSSDYVTKEDGNSSSSTEGSGSSNVIDIAKSCVGVRYLYSGTSMSGFDCSGFTQYVFGKIGVALFHSSSGQATQGTAVEKNDLKAGDLVFFDTNGGHNSISHVGLYIGDNMFIHSASSSGVVISSMSESYYANRYMCARRILN